MISHTFGHLIPEPDWFDRHKTQADLYIEKFRRYHRDEHREVSKFSVAELAIIYEQFDWGYDDMFGG